MQNICYCCDDCVVLPSHQCGNTYKRINQFEHLLALIENKLDIIIGRCNHSNLKIEEGDMFSYNRALNAKYNVIIGHNEYFLNDIHYRTVLKSSITNTPLNFLRITIRRELSNEQRSYFIDNVTIDIEELHKYLQDHDIMSVDVHHTDRTKLNVQDYIGKYLYGFTIVQDYTFVDRSRYVVRKNTVTKSANKN